jgi:Fe-S-cluster containining protein
MTKDKLQIEPECERCGKCCDTYSFHMSNRFFDDDPTEIKKLIEYHNCTPIRVSNPGGKDFLGIRIPQTCVHLKMVKGKAVCKIHDKRPRVCKEYFCKKVIEKALRRGANGIHI